MSSEVKLIEDWRERWEPVTRDGCRVLAVAKTPHGMNVFAAGGTCTFAWNESQLIPKAKPKTIRPWKREEVPVGSVVRNLITGNLYVITSACENSVCLNSGVNTYSRVFEDFVLHRTTESGEWLPVEQCPKCGVEE